MKRQGIGPGGFLMALVAVSFLVFCIATRWGLDLFGPWLAQHLGFLR